MNDGSYGLARVVFAELADDYGRRTGLAVLPEVARVVLSELAVFSRLTSLQFTDNEL